MKNIIYSFLLIIFISCSEYCNIDNEKLGILSLEAEAIRKLLNEASTPALQGVYQLQLDLKRKEMDEVAQACN